VAGWRAVLYCAGGSFVWGQTLLAAFGHGRGLSWCWRLFATFRVLLVLFVFFFYRREGDGSSHAGLRGALVCHAGDSYNPISQLRSSASLSVSSAMYDPPIIGG